MVFVYVPHGNQRHKASKADTVLGFLIAALVAVGFGLLIALLGPKSGPKPPAYVVWGLAGLALVLGLATLSSWLHRESNGSDGTPDNNSQEEQ